MLNDAIAALLLGGAAVYPLFGLAVAATAIVLDKAILFAGRARLPGALVDALEADDFSWDGLKAALGRVRRHNYARRFIATIVVHRAQPAWWIESRAADEASLIERALGRWLWVLETIVTAAPLLGLLGTIIGMVRAFNLFGQQGLVDPGGVTGGVAEALIATAVGLFVALLALFGFNLFARRQAAVMDELERLGTRLADHIRLDQERPGERPSEAAAPPVAAVRHAGGRA
ncbi:MAG: MotA/TolQ/ExbB proton channel family protein [Alphaproteobacteria bacterium]|nr:MotA/TolQ/ExbB proton channel family protein [Alphaproteobacteria bacterium]